MATPFQKGTALACWSSTLSLDVNPWPSGIWQNKDARSVSTLRNDDLARPDDECSLAPI